jgi:hypothetical protein
VFEALQNNKELQYLNISMSTITNKVKFGLLCSYIRQGPLIHLDCSGMLNDHKQVIKLIKAVSRSPTLLALHLSNTPLIVNDCKLQAYIRRKLNTNKLKKNVNSNPPCDKVQQEKQLLQYLTNRGRLLELDNLNN